MASSLRRNPIICRIYIELLPKRKFETIKLMSPARKQENCIKMFSRIVAVAVCDAKNDDSSNSVRLKKQFPGKYLHAE